MDSPSRRHLALDLVQEADKFLMTMTLHVAADDGPIENVEGSEERGRSMPLVIVGHRRAAAGLHGQASLRAVERLDLALLLDAEDDGVRRRVDIEPDDVAQLLDEGRIVGELEGPPFMRRKTVRLPDRLDGRDRQTDRLRHRLRRPMRRLVRRRSMGQPYDLLHCIIGNWRRAGRACLIPKEAVDAFLHKALLPAPDRRLRLAGRGPDRVRADAIGAHEHDPRPPNIFLRRVAIGDDALQPTAMAGFELD